VAVESKRPALFKSATEVIGCLVAPMPIVAVGVIESLSHTSFNVTTIVIISFIAYIGALGFTLVLGYPLYRVLLRFNLVRWWTCIFSGFAIGALVTILTAHPVSFFSSGVLVNSSAAAVSGLFFWMIQQSLWGQKVASKR
jgi:hypothetical protein